jgi:hypothetical protein
MSPLENDRILFQADASTLAFRAGQFVEKLLLTRGLQSARESQSALVTVENIQSCIDHSLLEQLTEHLHERAEQESRKVA